MTDQWVFVYKKNKLCDKSQYNKVCDKTCVGSVILEGTVEGKYFDDSHLKQPEPFDNGEYEVDHLSVVTDNNKFFRLHCKGWPGYTEEPVIHLENAPVAQNEAICRYKEKYKTKKYTGKWAVEPCIKKCIKKPFNILK